MEISAGPSDRGVWSRRVADGRDVARNSRETGKFVFWTPHVLNFIGFFSAILIKPWRLEDFFGPN
jgi:hypothetical protein